MEYLFKILFGKGAATALAALLVFTVPEMTEMNGVITVSGKLNGIFTNRVERIIRTGTEVRIMYDLTIIVNGKSGKTIHTREITNTIRYNNLENNYLCTSDHQQSTVADKDAAFRHIKAYSAEIALPDSLTDHTIDFYIEASIAYASALEIAIPDNTLWDYYIPNRKIRNCPIKETP